MAIELLDAPIADTESPPVRSNPFQPISPADLPKIFDEPDFQALPYERRRDALKSALDATYEYASALPDFTDDASADFGELARAAYAKLDAGHTIGERAREVGGWFRDVGKGLLTDAKVTATAGMSAAFQGVAALDRTLGIKPMEDPTGGAAQQFGKSFALGGAKYIDSAAQIADSWFSPADNALKSSLASVKEQIDSGAAPITDPAKFASWLQGQSDNALKPQTEWTATRLSLMDPQFETNAPKFAAQNQLSNPINSGLLMAYVRTRDPAVWDQLEKKIAGTPLNAAFGEAQAKIADSEAGKIIDGAFGDGSSEHLASAADPLVIASYVLPFARAAAFGKAAAAAKVGTKFLSATEAGPARALTAAKGLAVAAPEQAAIGAGMTLGHEPESTVAEVATGAGQMVGLGAVMHAGGVGLGEAARGVAARAERLAEARKPATSTEPPIPEAPAGDNGPYAPTEPAIPTADRAGAEAAAATGDPAVAEHVQTVVESADAAPSVFTPEGKPPPPLGEQVPREGADQPLVSAGAPEDLPAPGLIEEPVRSIPENATPTAEVGIEAETTSVKNAVMEAERAQRNADPLVRELRQSNQATFDEADRRIDADPNLGQNVVDSLTAGAKNEISEVDMAVLLHEKIRLRNLRDAEAGRSVDPEISPSEQAAAKQRATDLDERMNNVDRATLRSGTIAGRALQIRQRLMNLDYTLAALEQKEQRSRPPGLTPEEIEGREQRVREQAAQHAELTKLVEEKQKALADVRAEPEKRKTAVESGERSVTELKSLIKQVGAMPASRAPKVTPETVFTQKKKLGEDFIRLADERTKILGEEIRKMLSGRVSMGIDPTVLPKVLEYGALKLTKATIKAGQWAKEVSAELGLDIAEVTKLWGQVVARANEMLKAAPRDIDAERASTVAGMKARLAEGDAPADLRRYAREIAKQHIEQGITELEPLSAAVHATLKEVIPEITAMEARDAWSGFGRWTELDKAPEKVILRQRSAEAQAVSKIELYEKGRPAPKTGVEQELPTEAKRALEKRAAKLAKDLGIVVTDPAKQLKSALDAIKTRLRNEIADMDFAIATGKRMVKDKSGVVYDTETQALKKNRDARKAAYDEAFPKEPITPEEQLRRAERVAQQNLERWNAKLADARKGVFQKAPGPELGPNPQRLQLLKDGVAAAKAQVDELRALANPARSATERALLNRRTRALNRTADLNRRIAEKDFSSARKPPVEGPRTKIEAQAEADVVAALAEKQKVETQFNKERAADAVANLSTGKKILRGIKQTKDASINIASSMDFSAPRQAFFAILSNATRLVTNPVKGARLLARPTVDMFRSWRSEASAQRIDQRIKQRPNALSGVDKITEVEYSPLDNATFSKYEENAHSIFDEWAALPITKTNFAKTVPARFIRKSNRAFISFLNVTRAGLLDELLSANFKEGDVPPTVAELKALGNTVNVLTGRGKLNPVLAEGASYFLWAPKLLTSRVQLVAGQPFYGGSLKTRKIVAKEYARIIAAGGALLAVSRIFDNKKENDPVSSDFGKIVRGNVRIDPWGGLQQITVLEERVRRGESKNLKTGKVRDSSEAGAIGRFLRTKLRPDWGTALNILEGENIVGEKTTVRTVARDLLTPLSYRDIYDIMKERGVSEGAAIWALGIFGAGVSHHEKAESATSK